MAIGKRAAAASESLVYLAVTAGVLILVNVLGVFASGRIDLTEKRLFSLSRGSRELASGLEDELQITAYFTEDLPPPHNATARYVRDILEEYRAASGGKIKVEFINPDDEDSREAADRAGVQKVQHQVIDNDSLNVVEGYRGVAFRYLGETKVIPVIENTEGLEYAITQIIKQLVGVKTKVGILTGHGAPTLAQGLTALRDGLPSYEFSEVDGNSEIDRSLKALIVVSPTEALTEQQLRRINQFVMNGGALGIFAGGVKVDLQGGPSLSGTPLDTGLDRLLTPWGLSVEQAVVADWQCGRAPMQTPFGQMLVPFPAVPIISVDEAGRSHPALFNLNQIALPFSSPIRRTDRLGSDREVRTTTLARTSENAWVLTGDSINLQPRNPREWRQGEASARHAVFPMVVALEGKLPSAFAAGAQQSTPTPPPASDIEAPARATRSTRVLVVGTSFFMRDEFMPPAQQGQPRELTSVLAFALDAIDWLAQDDDLIAIRAKNVEDPQLEVPANVREAQEARDEALQDAQAAIEEAAQTGQEQAVQDAATVGRQNVEQAARDTKAALESWDRTKQVYRFAHMVGLPLLVAVFGLVRWQLRANKKKTLKL